MILFGEECRSPFLFAKVLISKHIIAAVNEVKFVLFITVMLYFNLDCIRGLTKRIKKGQDTILSRF